MVTQAPSELTHVRRVFAAWSLEVPVSFAETFIEDNGYWHAYDEHRSISLTSLTLEDERGPVDANEIARQLRTTGEFQSDGPIDELPQGLLGWSSVAPAPSSSRASRMLQGVVVTNGRVLLATITSDELDWTLGIWRSIRWHPAILRRDKCHARGNLNREATRLAPRRVRRAACRRA